MIGIIGFGYVGQAVYSAVPRKSSIMINDKYKDVHNNKSITEIKENCDIIFICVSTPENEDGSCDTSNVLDVLKELEDYNEIIVIKSTIPENKIPRKSNICYNPEFLNANTAIEDFKNQKYIILGGDINVTSKVERIYKNRFNINAKYEHCSIKEASDFKYIRNIYSAYKLMFWEFVQDTTGNSRKMAEMLKNIPVQEMDSVGMDGFRGFGGACLPKDVNAWHYEHNHKLTKFLKEYNANINK
jgi:UDPglucose 6-dehydrogenase